MNATTCGVKIKICPEDAECVLVVCPEDAECGQQFPLNIPDDPLFHPRGNDEADVDTMEAGWKRLIRVEDRKFQWVLFDDCSSVDAHSTEEAFDV